MTDQTKRKGFSQKDFENSTEPPPQLTVVKFNRTNLKCLKEPDGTILVAIKPICEAIGIHTDKAMLSIKADSILKDVHTIRYGRDTLNKKNMMTYIPLDYLPGWLFQINETKVSETAKPKLIAFKRECYQVLFNHFYGKFKFYEQNLDEKRKLMYERDLVNDVIKTKRQELNIINKQIRNLDKAALSGQYTFNNFKGVTAHA